MHCFGIWVSFFLFLLVLFLISAIRKQALLEACVKTPFFCEELNICEGCTYMVILVLVGLFIALIIGMTDQPQNSAQNMQVDFKIYLLLWDALTSKYI